MVVVKLKGAGVLCISDEDYVAMPEDALPDDADVEWRPGPPRLTEHAWCDDERGA